eukprot:2267556-Prymnesium_polylepis.1
MPDSGWEAGCSRVGFAQTGDEPSVHQKVGHVTRHPPVRHRPSLYRSTTKQRGTLYRSPTPMKLEGSTLNTVHAHRHSHTTSPYRRHTLRFVDHDGLSVYGTLGVS